MTDLWLTEETLWLEGADAFQRVMADACLMVFAPMGIMRADQIVESLRQAPRWTGVTMTERAEAEGGPDTRTLAYRAHGTREGAEPYQALCTSTYIHTDGHWRLLQHQQTPL